ncbi:MAG: hypothetical protein [Circular genetic element sp.]|nr:MAG: hypothetical protein [Circular genetic element sp.]
MAKKRYSKRMTKIQPAVQRLTFTVPDGESYIDLALAASIANRRGYSQQWSVAVASMKFYTSAAGNFQISKLPETWVMENAYLKSRRIWDEMNEQVLENEPSILGVYHDFKIAMDSAQLAETIQDAANPFGKILTPQDSLGNFTTADFTGVGPIKADWNLATIQVPNDPASGVTTEYNLHAVGPDTPASKGLVTGYALSRSRPLTQEPNVPTVGGWMTDLFDDGEQLDELRLDLTDDNDRPPYAVAPQGTSTENYGGGSLEFPGLQIHAFETVSTTTVGAMTSAPGGIFMCGLIKINNTTGNVANLLLDLVPGSHKGYLCEEL